jgi:hypothetical protein
MSRSALRAVILGLAVLACGEGGASDLVTVRDSAGIRIVTNAPPRDGVAAAVEDLSIGVVEGNEAYMFASVEAMAVGPRDTIYVIDAGPKQVKVYDAAGRHVRTFGREGEGPGEFRDPGPATFFGDTLVVFDWRLKRLTYFRNDGTVLATARTELPTTFAHGFGRLDDTSLVVEAVEGYSPPPQPDKEGKSWLLRLAFDGRVLDTLLVTTGVDQVVYRSETVPLMVRVAPFPRGPRWAVAPNGHIAYGRGERYQIGIYDLQGGETDSIGRLATLIRHDEAPRPVTDADIEAYRNRWLGEENLTPSTRRLYEDVLATVTYPATWPAFNALRSDEAGRLWARRPPRDADTLVSWDVFDGDGRLVRPVAVPKALDVHAITADAFYGVMRDELDVQYVKRFVLP